MKKIFITLILTALIISFNRVNGQTGNLSVSQTNNGSTIDISVYLKRTGAVVWSPGFASLVLNYNYNSMNSPVEFAEGLWDNNTNAQYDDQIIASYNGNKCISIEIGLNALGSGTAAPVDSAVVGKIRFNISNSADLHNISWNTNYSTIIDVNGNDITSGMNFYNPPNAFLPVELISFSYSLRENNVNLNWTTSNEINNYGFEIQRKNSAGDEWISAGFVAGKINSHELTNYIFEDKNLPQGNYNYRLKQIDLNGNWTIFDLNNSVEINNPEIFSLSQNYPNPFNPDTKISFNIPEENNIKLSVYDISGKLVKVLLNEFKLSGYYTVNFNGAGLSSGIYIYELNNGREILTKYMTLIK
jgi:hypothetical protein